jgi:hypothetical protein
MSGGSPLTQLSACDGTCIIFKLEARIVSTEAHGAIELADTVPHVPLPSDPPIGDENEIRSVQNRSENMGFTGEDFGKHHSCARFEVHVASRPAFLVCMLAGVAFYRNGDSRVGLNVPHRIEEIASVLRPKFQADLATQLA